MGAFHIQGRQLNINMMIRNISKNTDTFSQISVKSMYSEDDDDDDDEEDEEEEEDE